MNINVGQPQYSDIFSRVLIRIDRWTTAPRVQSSKIMLYADLPNACTMKAALGSR